MMPQMQELMSRVHDALPEPWNKKVGRPKSCNPYLRGSRSRPAPLTWVISMASWQA
jgi:hypothetical protein